MKQDRQSSSVSHGVEELIGRLREEGVEAGKAEAGEVLAEAEKRAREMVEQARREAAAIRAEAEDDAERLQRNTEEALKAAMSQTVLELRGQLLDRFSADVRRLVSDAMEDKDLIGQLIVEVAAGARDGAGVEPGEPVEALLPASLGETDLRQDLDDLRDSPLTQLVLARTGVILHEGVTLGVREDGESGLVLRLREGDVEIELSPQEVARVLLAHLQPRFRAIFDGVIR